MTRSELVFSAAVTLVASGLAAVIGVRMSAHGQDSITTHGLTLLDSRNQPIAVLSSQDGGGALVFYDQQHRKRSILFLEPNGTPDLYFYDAEGTPRAAFDLYDSGVPNMGFGGGPGHPSVLLESTKEGNIRLAFYQNQNGKRNRAASLEFNLVANRPVLQLLDQSGKTVWKAR